MVILTFVLAISFFLSSILPASIAQQVRRRVVDDSDPGISYTDGTTDGQPGQWAAMDATKQDVKCAAVNCWNVLDAQQVHGGTWHEGYGSVTISYTFNGTGIAAYFVSSNPSDATADTSFFIDGQLSQTVVGPTNGMASPLSYNVPVFAISNLQDGAHELVISQSGGSSIMMFDYLTYEELVDDDASSNGLTTATSAGAQATTGPVDPLRVPSSHGVARSTAGAAVASALIGTLLLVVAVGIFLSRRTRKNLAILVPPKSGVGKEAQLEAGVWRRPRPLNVSYSGEPQSKPRHIASHYNESTTDENSDESSVAQPERPDRRSRFRSAVSTVVGALSPCQITSFSRLELRTALAALIHPGHQQQHGIQHNAREDTPDLAPSFTHLTVPVTSQPASPKASNTPLGSITSSPSFRSVSSISSTPRPPSVPPTAPLRLPRSLGQWSPPCLPRFTFEERRRPDTSTDPEVLQRQIQALLWNAPPLPNRAPTPSAPPPYASRPSTMRASLASRRTTTFLPAGPGGNSPPLPPLPPLPAFPEKVATRI